MGGNMTCGPYRGTRNTQDHPGSPRATAPPSSLAFSWASPHPPGIQGIKGFPACFSLAHLVHPIPHHLHPHIRRASVIWTVSTDMPFLSASHSSWEKVPLIYHADILPWG